MAASLADIAWLAQRLEQLIRRDEYEHTRDTEATVWYLNLAGYLDFLMRLLPAKAALEAARIQDETNRQLVKETKGLATWTIVLALAAIGSLGASVAF